MNGRNYAVIALLTFILLIVVLSQLPIMSNNATANMVLSASEEDPPSDYVILENYLSKCPGNYTIERCGDYLVYIREPYGPSNVAPRIFDVAMDNRTGMLEVKCGYSNPGESIVENADMRIYASVNYTEIEPVNSKDLIEKFYPGNMSVALLRLDPKNTIDVTIVINGSTDYRNASFASLNIVHKNIYPFTGE